MGFKPRRHLTVLHEEIRACRICAADLPLGPRPVTQFSARSAVAIIGQAPGTRVHETGVPWDDPSGDHLRAWLAVDRATFYDPDRFALVPMGFCYPGKKAGGDAPPRPECAPAWHARVFAAMHAPPLLLLAGQYAHAYYLPERAPTLTETVRRFRDYGPDVIPLPHPSWRSRLWMKKNLWFERDLLPDLRRRIGQRLG